MTGAKRFGFWRKLSALVVVVSLLALAMPVRATPPPPTPHVYVHYDYLTFSGPDAHTDKPDPQAIQQVVDAYAAHGIDLVVDSKHTAIPAISGQAVLTLSPEGGQIYMCKNGQVGYGSLQSQYFHPTSNHEWHYAVFGDYIDYGAPSCQPGSSSGLAEINGDNLIVAVRQVLPLTAARVAGTFMHELGHNLGLRHGGNVDENYKPNYLSVMNYRFQGGIPFAANLGSTSIAGRRLDYSGAALPTLDESHLDETVGIRAGSTDITFWDTPYGFGVGPASGAIDWNLDGSRTDTDEAVDLDWFRGCFCDAVQYERMTGFDDWAEIHGYLDGTLVHGPKTIVGENQASEPTVTRVSPDSGPATGGTSVTISGTHFNKATDVVFGAAGPAKTFTVIDDKTIVAVTPPADLAGYVTDVTVVSGANASPSVDTDLFTYVNVLPVITGLSPSSGPGGTVITVSGFNFTGTHDVLFGDNNSLGFVVIDDDTLTVQSPGYLLGPWPVFVINAYGSNLPGPADTFLFTVPVPPAVTSVSPMTGPSSGGTAITIRGTGFSAATSVLVGPYAVASYLIVDDTTITAVTSPAGAVGSGTFDVTVTSPFGSSAISAADQFTYE